MSRARKMVLMVRICLVLLSVTVGILVFGPFGGDEELVGLTDKEAHAAAFYALAAMGLLALPRLRKTDVALICLAAGGLIEVIQTFIGRDGEIGDWLADSLGVCLAIAPMYFQVFRQWVRTGRTTGPKRRAGDQKAEVRIAADPVQD